MAFFSSRARLRDFLTRIEPRVEAVLALLSMLAIALVAGNEIVTPGMTLPLVGLAWSDLHIWLRTIIWLVFVVDFVAYASVSKTPLDYARSHVLEFIICVTWFPYAGEGFIRDLGSLQSLANFVSVDVLQLIGTLAHGWRVVRWTAQRFSAHPLLVTGSAALLLVASAAALLQHFEPATFPSFWDAAWYALVTITTIGYGDIVPHTSTGRAIGVVLIVSGISLAGVFLGLISEMVKNRLLKRSKPASEASPQDIKAALDRNNELQEQILEELRTNNRLLKQLLNAQPSVEAPKIKALASSPESSSVDGSAS